MRQLLREIKDFNISFKVFIRRFINIYIDISFEFQSPSSKLKKKNIDRDINHHLILSKKKLG